VSEPEHHLALSAADAAYLHRYAGVREATEEELAALAVRTAARDAYEHTHSLTRPAVTALLGTSEREAVGMTRAGKLYSHELVGTGPRWPDWQFSGAAGLPSLREVLAALALGAHPVTLRAFMTTPDSALRHNDVFVSPRDWLFGGGAASPILELATVLGEQI